MPCSSFSCQMPDGVWLRAFSMPADLQTTPSSESSVWDSQTIAMIHVDPVWHLQSFWNLQRLAMSAASPCPVQTLREGHLKKHFTSNILPRLKQRARTTVNSMLRFHWWHSHTAAGLRQSKQTHETHARQLPSNGLHHFESENPETCIQLWHVIVHCFCSLSVVSQQSVLKLPCGTSTLMFSCFSPLSILPDTSCSPNSSYTFLYYLIHIRYFIKHLHISP